MILSVENKKPLAYGHHQVRTSVEFQGNENSELEFHRTRLAGNIQNKQQSLDDSICYLQTIEFSRKYTKLAMLTTLYNF